MKLADVLAQLERIAPLADAEPWDNAGLICGDPAADVDRAILCIDYTHAVAGETARQRCGLVIAYHPPLFKPVSRIISGEGTGLVFDAVRRGIAIYSPHTALDAAVGGTNDVLADLLDLSDRRPLRVTTAKADHHKLVVFAPEDALEKVAEALFAAGAGGIGDYTRCSFRSQGQATFQGSENTHPAVGQAGEFTRTTEVRIEVIVPVDRVGDVVAALRAAHPYEMPAFELQQLAAAPTGRGVGRVGVLPNAMSRGAVVDTIKQSLGLPHVLVAGPLDRDASRVAVCAGSGGDLLGEAMAQRADVYVTGELRHHDALTAARAGMTVLCTLHSNSERPALTALAAKLTRALPGLSVLLSAADSDPFVIR